MKIRVFEIMSFNQTLKRAVEIHVSDTPTILRFFVQVNNSIINFLQYI